jgi:hypothetical protein
VRNRETIRKGWDLHGKGKGFYNRWVTNKDISSGKGVVTGDVVQDTGLI